MTVSLLAIVLGVCSALLLSLVDARLSVWLHAAIGALIYLIMRFYSFETGKYLGVVVLPAVIILEALLNPNPYAPVQAAVLMLVLFVLASIVFEVTRLAWTAAYFIFSMLLLLATQNYDMMFNAIFFVSLVVILLVILITKYLNTKFSEQIGDVPLNEIARLVRIVEPLTPGLIYGGRYHDGNPQIDWVYGQVQALLSLQKPQVEKWQGWERAVLPQDVDAYRRRYHNLEALQQVATEYRVQINSEIRWLKDDAHLVVHPQTGERYVIGTVKDITDRIVAEAALRTHIVQQAVVAELGLLAVSLISTEDLVKHAILLIEQVIDIAGCEILAYEPETQRLTVVAGSDNHPRAATTLDARDPSAPFGTALRQGEVLIVRDIPNHEHYCHNAYFRDNHINQCVSVVIFGSGHAYGLLNAYLYTSSPFGDDEVYFLQSVSNIISTFVQRIQSQEEQRAQLEVNKAMREATALLVIDLDPQVVFDRILEVLATVMPPHQASSLMMVNDDDETLFIASQRGYDDQMHILRHRRFAIQHSQKYRKMMDHGYYIINDMARDTEWIPHEETAWIRSHLSAPILLNGRFTGMINLDSNRLNTFTPEHGVLLRTFADKAAIAISSARRANELEALVRERTQQLRWEQQQLQAILDATGEGIYYTEHGIIRFANQALFAMTGYTRDDLIGKSSMVLHPDRDETTAQFLERDNLRHLMQSHIWRSEGNIRRKDGTDILAGLTTSYIHTTDTLNGLVAARAVTVVRDISLQKELEAQQKRFISNAAHELRTPITNLNTRLYLMEKSPDRLDEHMQMLRNIVNRMNRLVSDLLDIAHIERGQLVIQRQSIIIQAVVEETIVLLRQEADQKEIRLETSLPEAPITLVGDPHRLQQVLTNLVINGINYTPTGGCITITAAVDSTHVEIRVADTGIGIPKSSLEAVFEPFYRVETRQKGTGLGLAITQEIVRLHQGEIRVESDEGLGSTFIVRLPLSG
jgi:PAS domain S-box-containing protein